jgi:Kef-type K+ transport system membrane component KefB
MIISYLPAWPLHPDGVFWVGAALVLATLTGESVFRFLRLPRLVGYAAAGMLLAAGGAGLNVYDLQNSARAIVDTALAVLLFEIGHRVNLRWLRANPALLGMSLLESALSFGAVWALLAFLGFTALQSAIVAGLLMATSPAVVLRIKSEFRANGQVSERLLLLSALNTFYALLICSLLLGMMDADGPQGARDSALHLLYLLGGSVLAAALLAWAVNWVERHFDFRDEGGALMLVGLIVLTLSLTRMLNWSALLTPLLAGALLRWRSPRPRLWPRHFGTAGGVLMVLLFLILGLSLNARILLAGGLAAALVIVVRLVAKLAGALAFGRVSGASWRQSVALGLSLNPASGVSFVLALSFLGSSAGAALHPMLAVAFSAIALLELLAPLLTRWALGYSGDIAPGAASRTTGGTT